MFGVLDLATADGGLGLYQPWVGIAAGDLVRYLDRLGVDCLYVDPTMPDDAWRWQPAQVRELAVREEEVWQRATR